MKKGIEINQVNGHFALTTAYSDEYDEHTKGTAYRGGRMNSRELLKSASLGRTFASLYYYFVIGNVCIAVSP